VAVSERWSRVACIYFVLCNDARAKVFFQGKYNEVSRILQSFQLSLLVSSWVGQDMIMMKLWTKFLPEAIDMSTEQLARESNDIRIPIFFWDEKLLWVPFVGGAGDIY
jgi:hypothetical protein